MYELLCQNFRTRTSDKQMNRRYLQEIIMTSSATMAVHAWLFYKCSVNRLGVAETLRPLVSPV